MLNEQAFVTARERMASFFESEISLLVLPDVERLTNEIRPDTRGLGGCTVPLAMVLFALVDLFGFLMRPDKAADKRDTERNYEYLLSESGYFPEEYRQHWQQILRLFRHGVMHQFFPKASAVAKVDTPHPLIYEQNSVPVLNVDLLSDHVVAAINQVREALDPAQSPELILRMYERLNGLAADDYKDLDTLRGSAEA